MICNGLQKKKIGVLIRYLMKHDRILKSFDRDHEKSWNLFKIFSKSFQNLFKIFSIFVRNTGHCIVFHQQALNHKVSITIAWQDLWLEQSYSSWASTLWMLLKFVWPFLIFTIPAGTCSNANAGAADLI